MTLKYTEETVLRVEHRDLDAFLEEETGVSGFSVVHDLELSNDSQERISVSDKPEEWERKFFEDFKNGIVNCGCISPSILNCLCEKGKLAPGVYLIMVCW